MEPAGIRAGASTPGASTPGASTPGASTPGASTPGASTPGASTPGASTPGTTLGRRRVGVKTTTPTKEEFNCGSKRYYKEMSSCEEVKYYLEHCGVSLDGDGEGVT